MSKAKAIVNAEYAIKKRIWWGDGRRCEFPGCEAMAEKQPHHAHGKLGTLQNYTPLWIGLCFKHHRWVHDNIEKARALKLIAEKGWWNRYPKHHERNK